MSYRDFTAAESSQNVNSDFDLRVLQVGFEHNAPGWYNLEHSHKSCELILLLQGMESVVFDGKRYEAKPHDLLIFDTGVVHQEFSSANLIREAIVITFDNFKLANLPENCILNRNDHPIFHIDEDNMDILEDFYAILEESRTNNPYSYSMCATLLKKIIIRILRDMQKPVKVSSTNVLVCEKVKNYIDEHYSEKINLDGLARMFYISKGHLSHLFKQQIGEAPVEYLINKRIEIAKDILTNTDEPISAVGEMVGYDSQAYFSQFFSKEVGMSPVKYRKIKKLM